MKPVEHKGGASMTVGKIKAWVEEDRDFRSGAHGNAPVIREYLQGDEIALHDEHGPLVWYHDCGSHTVAMAPRFAKFLGLEITEEKEGNDHAL